MATKTAPKLDWIKFNDGFHAKAYDYSAKVVGKQFDNVWMGDVIVTCNGYDVEFFVPTTVSGSPDFKYVARSAEEMKLRVEIGILRHFIENNSKIHNNTTEGLLNLLLRSTTSKSH